MFYNADPVDSHLSMTDSRRYTDSRGGGTHELRFHRPLLVGAHPPTYQTNPSTYIHTHSDIPIIQGLEETTVMAVEFTQTLKRTLFDFSTQ